MEEKIAVLDHFHASGDNKKRTVRELGVPCAKMLREWLRSEKELRDASASISGMRRFSRALQRAVPRPDSATSICSPEPSHSKAFSTIAVPAEVCTPPANGLLILEAATAKCFLAKRGITETLWTDSESNAMHQAGINNLAVYGTTGAAQVVHSAEGCSSEGALNNGSIQRQSSTQALQSAVPPLALRNMVENWLQEDCPAMDYGGAVVGENEVEAVLYAKSDGVLAGTVFFDAVFDILGCAVSWNSNPIDGDQIQLRPENGGRLELATVRGPARLVLLGERVALNALAECSGVATAAHRFVAVARQANWEGRLAGTRKTSPGLRLVQKYGMIAGGMDPHRFDLSSMIMLKDNHIAACGSITAAVNKARGLGGFSVKIDVECGTVQDAEEAALAGADVVMLDNFPAADFREAAQSIKSRFPHIMLEGSGGITLDVLRAYFCPEADVLSLSVNKYATPLDLSLKIRNPN